MTKRPKITVTPDNIEFVIPTLEKLGGKKEILYTSESLCVGEVYYLDLNSDEILQECTKGMLNSVLYEVDPKDYVRPNEPILMVGADSYPKTLETIIEAQKAELDKLKIENEKLRECLGEYYQTCIYDFRFKALNEQAKQLLNK